MNLGTVGRQANLSLDEAQSQMQALMMQGDVISLNGGSLTRSSILLASSTWDTIVSKARTALEGYHRQFPLRRGAPREEIRGRLGVDTQVSALAMQRLEEEGVLVVDGPGVRLPQHSVSPSPAQRRLLDDYVHLLESEPYSPPTAEPPEPDLLNLLVEEGKVAKVSETVVFSAPAYEKMVERITQHLKSNGKITVAEVRDLFNTSRKYALALMEHLDQRRITRRVGDERVLR